MTSPKTIDYVDLDTNRSLNLGSFYFERLVRKTLPTPVNDLPHRHNYQEMLIIHSGHGRHAIDGESSELLPRTISLITKGQVHIFEHATELTGWLVRFTDDFMPTDFIGQSWNYHTTLFNQLGTTNTVAIPLSDLRGLEQILQLIEAEYASPAGFEMENTLRHLLSVLIVRIERIVQQAACATRAEREEYRLCQSFMALLEQDFAQHHNVQHYAAALAITPVRLSSMLSRIVGKSTKQLIDERIVLEAKRYLHYTDRSVKEIADNLGYTDLFHFSKAFKRLTGAAPQLFREQREKMT